MKGSTARKERTPSWTSREQREELVANRKLVDHAIDKSPYVFAADVPFDDPSAAAIVVRAGNTNGRKEWKEAAIGKNYGEWKALRLKLAGVNLRPGERMVINQHPETLFADRPRVRLPRTRQESESHFEFCDRLDEPRLNAGREIVNGWFAGYPDALRPELLARLKSRTDTDHHSALFELGLLAALRAAGLDARAVQATASLTVDLSIHEAGAKTTHIEATTVLGELSDPFFRLMQHVTRQILQDEPRLRINVHDVVETNQNPSAKHFSKWLLHEFKCGLASLDDRNSAGPVQIKRSRYSCTKSGWKVDLTLLCWEKPEPPRSSIVLTRSYGASFHDSAPQLHRKIKEKLQQHRNLDGPLVVAVSWADWPHEPDQSEILNALCGVLPRNQPLRIAALLLTSGVHVWTAEKIEFVNWIADNGQDGPWRRWPFPQIRYSTTARCITSS